MVLFKENVAEFQDESIFTVFFGLVKYLFSCTNAN